MKKILVIFSFLFLSVNLFAEDDFISVARQAVANEDYYKALIEYTKVLKKEKDDYSLFFERGNVRYKLDNYIGAIGDYTSSLELEISSQAYVARGKAKLLTNQIDGAIEDFNEALKIEESAYVYALLSDANFKKGNYDKSIENYTNAIRLSPIAYFYANRGIVYKDIKDYNNAIQDYTKAIELDSNNIEYYTLRYGLYNIMKDFDLAEEDKATIDTINGNYEAAIKKLSGVLNNKEDYTIHYKLGLLRDKIGDYTGSINSFTSAIELKKTPEALFERGKTKTKIRKYNGAIYDFDMSIKMKKDPNVYFEIAETYCLLKKFEEAIPFYDKALKLDHNNIDIIVRKAEVLYSLEKYKEIVLENAKVLYNSDDVRLLDVVAKAEYKIGMYEDALKNLEKSLAISPKIETYILIAEIYEKTEEYMKAILNYTIAIGIEKENVGFVAKQHLKDFYLKRSKLYELIGRKDLAQADIGYLGDIVGSYQNNVAIADFTKSLEMKQNSEVYIARGNLKLKNQDYEEAMADFNEALKLKQSSLVYLSIGKAQMQMDEDEEALKSFSNALNISAEAEKEDIYVAFAKLMEKKNNFEDAIMYYTKALEMREKRVYYLARASLYEKISKKDLAVADKGNIKFMFNNYKEAINDYTNSLEIYENAFVYAKRGEAEEKIGKYEEAFRDYIKAIELDGTGKYVSLKESLLSKLSKEQKEIFQLKQFEKLLFKE